MAERMWLSRDVGLDGEWYTLFSGNKPAIDGDGIWQAHFGCHHITNFCKGEFHCAVQMTPLKPGTCIPIIGFKLILPKKKPVPAKKPTKRKAK
jgi:hypothetical protein